MIVVGVTDTMGSEHKFQKYLDWLKRGSQEVKCVALSYALDNLNDLDSCDALVLTGGHDVAPELYGGMVGHPKIVDVDKKRDAFEMKALEAMLRLERPVLGICRGMQLANVYFGGTLIADLQEAGYADHRSAENQECRHSVSLQSPSILHTIVRSTGGMVNSSHHQAVGDVGNGLTVAARSSDGVIEALEPVETIGRPFLLFVQWHPERMHDRENPLSQGILDAFYSSINHTQGVHST